jgi:hypothetical protein
MNPVTARPLAAVALCAAFALAGCTSATNDQPSTQTATTTTTTEPTTSASLVPACQDLVDKAQTLVTEIGRLTTRSATVADVQAAADALGASFDDAKATLGAEAKADLDAAGQALQQVQDALKTQPIDTAALRTGAAALVTSLGDAAKVCSASASTTETSTDTGTDTGEPSVTPTPTS